MGQAPTPGLSKELKLSEVPQLAQGVLKAATQAFESCTNIKTGVDGYFAISKSESDKTIVGYALTGQGWRDGQKTDARVIAANVAGEVIFDKSKFS